LRDFERDFSKAASKRKVVEGKESTLAKRIRLDNREAYNEEQEGQKEHETRLQMMEEVSHNETPGNETT
jgi:hypothetical protein